MNLLTIAMLVALMAVVYSLIGGVSSMVAGREVGATDREFDQALACGEVGRHHADDVLEDLDGDGWLDIYATTGFMSFERRKPDG